MKSNLRWNREKNNQLLLDRGLYFELVVEAFDNDAVIRDMKHPQGKRENQRMILIKVNNYVCAVPIVQDGDVKFLKTMYFSRKFDEVYGDHNG